MLPTDEPVPIPEVIMAVSSRRASSVVSDALRANPVTFDKSGAQTVASLSKQWTNQAGHGVAVLKVSAHVGTAPTGASLKVDVLIDGTSVFAASGDQVTIAAGSKNATAVPTKTGDDIVVKPGQTVTVGVTQIGSGTAGSDLNVAVALG
jgi:hypothetical protein